MKKECSSVSKLLEKYFDQEVTGAERSLVEGHLPDCPSCRDVLRSMERLRNLIRTPVEEDAEKETFPWVWQKIERKIQLEEKRVLVGTRTGMARSYLSLKEKSLDTCRGRCGRPHSYHGSPSF